MNEPVRKFRGRSRRVLDRFFILHMVLWAYLTSAAIHLYFKLLLYFEDILSPVEWFWIPLLLQWYLLREKESLSSNIFRQFLQRLKSPKLYFGNSPDFGRGSRVAVDDKWLIGQTYFTLFNLALYQIKTFLCLFHFWGSDLYFFWVPSQSGKIINVDFSQGLIWSYYFYFLVSTGLIICCVCLEQQNRDIITFCSLIWDMWFFCKTFTFPVLVCSGH